MGVALGWMALALAAVSAAPESGRGGVPIKYTVRFVEVEGLEWRDAVFARLTPVTRQGAATVWTAPSDVTTRLVQHAAKNPAAPPLQAPTVTAWSGAPAHIATRSHRRLVTQVSWNGIDPSVAAKPETVRTGSATTLTGRKLDQGILVQMVIQDTQILAVHRVALGGSTGTAAPGYVKNVHYSGQAADGSTARRTCTGSLTGVLPQKSTSDAATASACCSASTACAACPKDAAVQKVAVEVPEIGSQEIAGEWLIPNNGVMLVSFGPHTVADEQGKAVIHERLAIVEAEEAEMPPGAPIAHEGFWSTPIYNVPVVASPSATIPAPVSTAPALNLPAGPAEMPPPPMPPVPSRSTPQGYDRDGKATELPPLPDDDAPDADDSAETAEPRPSPQSKKPQRPGPTTEATPQPARPSADTAMKKAQYAPPSSPPLPTLFQPAPMVGLQFLLPIKPVSFKLPFNRRLELEVYGRIVRSPETVRPTEVVTKPGDGEKTTK